MWYVKLRAMGIIGLRTHARPSWVQSSSWWSPWPQLGFYHTQNLCNRSSFFFPSFARLRKISPKILELMLPLVVNNFFLKLKKRKSEQENRLIERRLTKYCRKAPNRSFAGLPRSVSHRTSQHNTRHQCWRHPSLK